MKEQKELCPWYDYTKYEGFRVDHNGEVNRVACITTINLRCLIATGNNRLGNDVHSSELVPYLRSMTDITKPLPDGNILLLECAKLSFNTSKYKWDLSGSVAVSIGDNYKYIFGIDSSTGDIRCTYHPLEGGGGGSVTVGNQITIFDYLQSLFFNIRGIECKDYNKLIK